MLNSTQEGLCPSFFISVILAPLAVIPVKTGIHYFYKWIPACAGMTMQERNDREMWA